MLVRLMSKLYFILNNFGKNVWPIQYPWMATHLNLIKTDMGIGTRGQPLTKLQMNYN
jgi:hypothetical protein